MFSNDNEEDGFFLEALLLLGSGETINKFRESCFIASDDKGAFIPIPIQQNCISI